VGGGGDENERAVMVRIAQIREVMSDWDYICCGGCGSVGAVGVVLLGCWGVILLGCCCG
jgi:hypothetical protein